MRESVNINKKSNSNPSTSAHSPLYSRPLATQRVKDANAVTTQEDIENQQYQQDKIETTKLETQAELGAITPEAKERLTVLQAKMAGFRQQLLNKPIYSNHDFSQIPVHHPDETPGRVIQPRLTIGTPGDKYEQEADRVATKVVNQINLPIRPPLRLQSINENQQHNVMLKLEPLQLKHPLQQQGSVSTDATSDLEASIQQAQGSGQTLADNVREPMEQAFGADFSGVRVHTDAKSDELNQSIQAKAFTTGQHVFFRKGAYQPGSQGGQELIAHELTHVVQQNGEREKPLNFVKQKPREALGLEAKRQEKSYVAQKPVIQRSILWDEKTEKIKEIRIDRPSGSAIGHHTSAYLLFIEAIENNLINTTFENAIKKIEAMALDLKDYPGYDSSNQKQEQKIDGVIDKANEELNQYTKGKLPPINYTHTIENLALLFLDARNALDYTIHEGGWGSQKGKSEAGAIKNFSQAFQNFDENNYTPKELDKLASYAIDLLDTENVKIDRSTQKSEKKDFTKLLSILKQHMITIIVAHPGLEDIQKELAEAMIDALVPTKVGLKPQEKKKAVTELQNVSGWSKLESI